MDLIFEFLNFTQYNWLNVSIYAIGVLLFAFIVLKTLRAILNRFIRKSSQSLKVDPTQYKFLSNALGFLIYTAALTFIFYSIESLRSLGLTLFAGAGVLAAIVGFASQAAFSNIVSGIFIVIFKPFRVGDIVRVGTLNMGIIEDITLRHTVIKDFENRRLVIPNSVISSETIHNANLIEDSINNHIFFDISYDSDIDLATRIIQEEAQKHTCFRDKRTEEEKANGLPAVIVRLLEFTDSSQRLRAQVWTDDPIDGFELKCDIHRTIKKRFDREGIEIPFPHRTLVYKEKKEKEGGTR